jgi:hypothetical protein
MSITKSLSEDSAPMLLAVSVGSIALGLVWLTLLPLSWGYDLKGIIEETLGSIGKDIDMPIALWSIHTVLLFMGRIVLVFLVSVTLLVLFYGYLLLLAIGVLSFYALVNNVVSRLKYSTKTLKFLAGASVIAAVVPLALLISGYFSYHPPVIEFRADREWGEHVSLVLNLTLAGVTGAFLFLAGKLYDTAKHRANS